MEPSPDFEPASDSSEPVTSPECEVRDNVGVQVGHGNVQHIHQAADNDVGLVIKYEREKINLDRDNKFYLEITNRTSVPKRLVLAIEGVRDTVVKVVPNNKVELPGQTMVERVLTLRCTETHPMAGSIPLQVVVIDADTGRVRLQSDRVRITVPPRPQLVSELAPPKQGSSTDHYASMVRLTNKGNTELRGTLCVSNDGPGYLSAAHVRLGGDQFDLTPGFNLSPGEHTEIPAKITFPDRGWTSRTWTVSVNANVENDEGIYVVRGRREVTQDGTWKVLRRHMARLPSRVVEWSRGQIRRGWLVGVGLILFAAGALTGQVVVPTSEDPRTVAQSASPGIVTESPTSTPLVAEAPYAKMPCEPGTSIVNLKSLAENEALTHGKWSLEVESARLRFLTRNAPDLRIYNVHASRRDELCPAALTALNPKEKYTVFLWVGPVPSAEATKLCASLGKPNQYDCLPLPTT